VWKTYEDVLQLFLQDEIETGTDFIVSKKDLFLRFQTWTQNAGEKELANHSQRWLTSRMMDRGFNPHGRNKSELRGLQLKA